MPFMKMAGSREVNCDQDELLEILLRSEVMQGTEGVLALNEEQPGLEMTQALQL